jgi:hypothetical protein
MIVQGKALTRRGAAEVRMDNWLWMYLRQENMNCNIGRVDDENVRAAMMAWAGAQKLSGLIEYVSKQTLLPHELLEWITEDGRQINWLLGYIHFQLRIYGYPRPAELIGRDFLIAIIDLWSSDFNSKAGAIAQMHRDWNDYRKLDKIFKWFKDDEEASRCEFAWDWLLERRKYDVVGKAPVSNYEDLLIFFDGLQLGAAQKKIDVAAIKGSWSQQKYRKKMVGKKQYNFLLSDKVVADLDKLVKKYGMNRRQILEALIQQEARKNLYLPDEMKSLVWGGGVSADQS